MKVAARIASVLMAVCLCTISFAQAAPKLDTPRIDAALRHPGAWVEGIYLVTFPRPDLRVMLDGVRLSTAHLVSFVTFMGTDDNSEMMGEICALPSEVTPAVAELRAGNIQITGIHNHFLGESPRLMFIHFMARGRAVDLARSFRAAVSATTTPLGKLAAPKTDSEPVWGRAVQHALGRPAEYLAQDRTLEVDVPSADFPPGPMDFWYESLLYFQQAPSGRVAATGDMMVTADEINPVLSILLAHHFRIEGVHNHMIKEHPRVFFVHFWKIGTPQDLADGLNATLAAMHTRQR